jgi:hypothetical protein
LDPPEDELVELPELLLLRWDKPTPRPTPSPMRTSTKTTPPMTWTRGKIRGQISMGNLKGETHHDLRAAALSLGGWLERRRIVRFHCPIIIRFLSSIVLHNGARGQVQERGDESM